ncbi:MAG: 16S rRNA (cytosine(967)-C(5))-methyltransferase RsmB [Gammaproteobacteria bacterium]|nr:16S rRNA (cytosine(967)-C(5))-methyltransferase RsmB [Gammaproteobacteria bacterium]
MESPKNNQARLLAARIIEDVIGGHALSDLLANRLQHIPERDAAFVKALCYGVCRYYERLDLMLSQLLKKPMRERDVDVFALLLVGLYQLSEMGTPQHAAVAETVEAAKLLKKPWCVSLVNALLREFIRNQATITAHTMKELEGHYAHPLWFIEKIKQDWPNHWESILTENNAHPPLTLRVNQSIISRDDYLQKIQAAGIHAHRLPETGAGIILEKSMTIEALPGFKAGEFSVQDGAAQLCAPLLELKPHLRVLDAAAAPGGKLTHLIELEPLLDLTALDKDPIRLQTIKINLQRLQQKTRCICADAANTKGWWDGKMFDRILLDAPCTGSGVVRRHSDMKLLKQPGDAKKLAQEQTRLLEGLWPTLAPGGILLYTTCSIFPDENQAVINSFLANHLDAIEEKIEADWGIPMPMGRQILPGMHQMDGFYFAKIKKKTEF